MTQSIIIDTYLSISASRSRNGASFKSLSLIDSDKFTYNLSLPLFLVYESVAKCMSRSRSLTHLNIDDIIYYLCVMGKHKQVHYLWRPNLKDSAHDFVLELAVEAESNYIVAQHLRYFSNISKVKPIKY